MYPAGGRSRGCWRLVRVALVGAQACPSLARLGRMAIFSRKMSLGHGWSLPQYANGFMKKVAQQLECATDMPNH
jgi:hypothetical protein